MRKLLYSLLFIISSSFATTTTTFTPDMSGLTVGQSLSMTVGTQPNILFNVGVTQADYNYACTSSSIYSYIDDLYNINQTFIYHASSKTGSNGTGLCTQVTVHVASTAPIPVLPTCTDSQYLNESNICVDYNNTDNTLFFNNLPKSECVAGQEVATATGKYKVIGYDNTADHTGCLIQADRCLAGQHWDDTTSQCVDTADNIYDNDGNCPGGDYGITKRYDFCEQCSGDSFYWAPPTGYENSGMQCNHSYVIYSCVKDYRIEKAPQEVACPWTGYQFNDMNITSTDDLNSSPTSSPTDMNNLPTIDPETASLHNSEQLTKIEQAIKDLKPLLQGNSDALKNISSELNGTNDKLSSIDGKLTDIKDILEANGTMSSSDVDSMGDGAVLGIDTKGLDDSSTLMDNLEENLAYLTDGITSIQTQFQATKDLITGNTPVISISSGGCNNEYLARFAGYLSPYSSVISLVTYIATMIGIFKMIFAYTSRGDN